MKRTTFFILRILIFSIISLQTTFAQVALEHESGVTSVALSRDGTTLASGAVDGTVKLWDVETHKNIATLKGHADQVKSVAFSSDGTILASGALDGTVKLWDVETYKNIATLKGHAVPENIAILGGHAVPVASVAFSPDDTILASGALDGTVKLWDVETYKNIATLGEGEYRRGWWTPVSFSPDDTILAFGARNGIIQLWDVETQKNITAFGADPDNAWGDPDGIVSMSFSPDGTTLAAGTSNSIIKLWDVPTRTNTTTFPSVTEAVSLGSLIPGVFVPNAYISFSPDGILIASTIDEGVALWNTETSTHHTLFGHTDVVLSVSFSGDGSLLATGALDGTVRLWDPLLRQEAFVASTEFPLTEANLHGSLVTFRLNGWVYEGSSSQIEDALTVSGIEGATLIVEHVSARRVTVRLDFDGTDFDTDATLTFTVGADAIANSNDQEFTAQFPVTAIQQSNAIASISPSPVVSPAAGEELTFNLNIESGENVVGYQATILFDRTAFDYVRSTNGDYLPANVFIAAPVVDYNWIEGSVTLAATTLAGAANGAGTLATLTFEIKDFKASMVTLSQVYLVDADGKRWEVTTENGEVIIPPEPAEALLGDINRDGVVNIQDLVIVGARYGQRGENSADLNGDHLVDIVDLVLVANAFGADAAAPSLNPQILEQLTAADIKGWLNQTQQLSLTDPAYLRGITVLEQLLMALTPKETALLPNYPNPFNPETWIPYHLSKDADVTLHIYAVNGTLVRTLMLGHQAAGMYQNRSRAAYWDGKNAFGEPVASGVYFYTLSTESTRDSVTAGDFTTTRKMLIRK